MMVEIWTRVAAKSATVVAALLFTTSLAAAAPIVGSLGFTGEFEAYLNNDETGGTTTDLTEAKSIKTLDDETAANAATGDFAAIPNFTLVDSFGDFNIDTSDIPLAVIWQVTHDGVTYQMSLDSLIVESVSSDSLEVQGLGTMTISSGGFDPTPGEFDATFNTTGASLNFSSTNASLPVPSPATFGLLGFGLIGMGLLGRIRKSSWR